MDSLYINGVDCTNFVKIGTPDMEFQLNTRAMFEMEFLDTSGTLRPELNDELIYTRDERALTASGSAASTVITASVGTFVAGDVGKVMVIPGAGVAGATLSVKITTFLSGTQVNVEFALDTTVAAAAIRVGNRIFAGTINDYDEQAFVADEGILMRVSCEDYNAKAELVLFNGIAVGPTLRDHVDSSLISGLDTYGIRRDPAMGTGPTVGILGIPFQYVMEYWKTLSRITGWVFYVDQVKVIRWVQVGTITAPMDIDSTIPLAGTFKIAKSYNQYRNSQWVWFGGSSQAEYTETFTLDGSTTRFTLEGAPVGGVISRGYLTEDSSGVTIDYPIGREGVGSLTWNYNPLTNELVRSSGGTSGDVVTVIYLNQFPLVANRTDSAGITAHGLRSLITNVESILTRADAEAYADDLLRRYSRTPRTVTFDTYDDRLAPGQTAAIDIPNRGLTGEDFLIVSVSSRDDASGEEDSHIIYSITALEGEEFQALWIEFFRDQAGGSLGGSTGQPAVAPPPSGAASDFPVLTGRTQAVTGSVNTYNISLPPHVAGDLITVFIGHSSHNDLSINVASTTGWTELVNDNTALSLTSGAVYYKIATSSDERLVISNATTNNALWIAEVYQNAIAIEASAAVKVNPQATTSDPANLTPTWGSDDTLWLVFMMSQSGTNGTITPPTGFGNYVRQSVGASQTSISLARREETASSKNPGTWSHSNQVSINWTLAIRPAP